MKSTLYPKPLCCLIFLLRQKALLCFLPVALFLMAAAPLSAQVIFYEDFDGVPGPTEGGAGTYSFPSGWFLRNVDNRTPNAQVAYINEAWERREDFGINVSDSCVFSTSYYSPTGPADDWMWTPAITLNVSNPELSWDARAYDPLYPDGYQVRIMTEVPTGGTGTLGNMVSSSTLLFSVSNESTGSWNHRTLDLTDYAGQTVYIGFRNNSNDQFILVIDDVKVENKVLYDAQALPTDTFFYHRIPFHQVEVVGLPMEGRVRNLGLNTLNNVNLQVNAYTSAGVLDGSSSGIAISSLASLASSDFTLPNLVPSGPESYTFKYFPTQSQTDQLAANDTLFRNLIVSDTTYARGNGTVTGGLGIGAGQGGYMGQSYTVQEPCYLSSATVYYTRGYAADRYALALWNTNPDGSPNSIIATTDTLYYPDDSARLLTLSFTQGYLPLTPGKYVITAIEMDSTLSLGLVESNFEPNSTWIDWPSNPFSGWSNNEDYGSNFAKTYALELNLLSELPSDNTYYADSDADGYGNIEDSMTAASQPEGYVSDSTDCNDTNEFVNPGQSEVCGNGIDDNCNGQTDEGCFCTSSGSGAPGTKFIKQIKFQTAAASVLINNLSNNNGGYADFTAMQASVVKGSAYKLVLNPSLLPSGNPMFRWKVWIDYNADGDFDDAGENVASVSSNGNVSTPNFTIPNTAVSGQALRMRISMKMGSAFATSCETGFNGEVEDYTVWINAVPALVAQGGLQGQSAIAPIKLAAAGSEGFGIYPNPARDEFFVHLYAPVTSAQAELQLTDLSGKLVYSQPIASGTRGVIAYSGPALVPGVYMIGIADPSYASYPVQKLVVIE